jgi:hypothetical protein
MFFLGEYEEGGGKIKKVERVLKILLQRTYLLGEPSGFSTVSCSARITTVAIKGEK